MKPLNKQGAGTLLAIAEAVLFVSLLVLQMTGVISLKAFIICFLIAGMITIAAVVTYLYKYPLTFEQSDFDPDSVKVPRTVMGTIVEVTAALFLLGASVLAIKTDQFVNMIGFFFVTTFALIDAYHPSDMILAGKLRNARQVTLAVNMNRIMALELSFLGVLAVIPQGIIPYWAGVALLLVIIATYVGFRILIHKAK